MNRKARLLSKNVLLFALSSFLPKILQILFVPIYTASLSTAEYGVVENITTTIALLLPIFTLDIQDAVMRFAMDKNYSQKTVFSTALRIVFCGGLLVVAGTFVASRFEIPGLERIHFLCFVVMYFTTAIYNVMSLFCRGVDKVKTITISSILNAAITLLANVLFLSVLQLGITGYLLANTLGAFAAILCFLCHGKLYRYWTTEKSAFVCKAMLTFSVPLIFNSVAWWVNNASDRYILSWISGVAVSGVYAVAAKVPTVLAAFQNVFAQAWSISAIKEFDENDTDGFIGNMYSMMNLTMILLCSVIMLLNIPIAKILYAGDFYGAWQYVPPLLVAVVFHAMSLFMGSIFSAVKDTKVLAVTTLAGAAVNIFGNILLISVWGAYGAALATLAGYVVTYVMRHCALRRHIRLKIRWHRDIAAYALLIVQMAAASGSARVAVQIAAVVVILVMYRGELRSLCNAVIALFKQKMGKPE